METHEQLAAAFLSAGILLVTFFRSTMGANDLGYRGILPAQFFLLLLTLRILPGASPVRFASAERPWAVRIIRVCVVLGCLATAYDWVGTRFGPLAVVFQRPETLRLHSQTRAAYEFLRRNHRCLRDVPAQSRPAECAFLRSLGRAAGSGRRLVPRSPVRHRRRWVSPDRKRCGTSVSSRRFGRRIPGGDVTLSDRRRGGGFHRPRLG